MHEIISATADAEGKTAQAGKKTDPQTKQGRKREGGIRHAQGTSDKKEAMEKS